jgi:hypothetical protein
VLAAKRFQKLLFASAPSKNGRWAHLDTVSSVSVRRTVCNCNCNCLSWPRRRCEETTVQGRQRDETMALSR